MAKPQPDNRIKDVFRALCNWEGSAHDAQGVREEAQRQLKQALVTAFQAASDGTLRSGVCAHNYAGGTCPSCDKAPVIILERERQTPATTYAKDRQKLIHDVQDVIHVCDGGLYMSVATALQKHVFPVLDTLEARVDAQVAKVVNLEKERDDLQNELHKKEQYINTVTEGYAQDRALLKQLQEEQARVVQELKIMQWVVDTCLSLNLELHQQVDLAYVGWHGFGERAPTLLEAMHALLVFITATGLARQSEKLAAKAALKACPIKLETSR